MLVTLKGIITRVIPQPLNALVPILEIPEESTRFDKAVQPLNALAPILVTEPGILTAVRVVQPLNALAPILVTLGGIDTLYNDKKPLKAFAGIIVLLSGSQEVFTVLYAPVPIRFIAAMLNLYAPGNAAAIDIEILYKVAATGAPDTTNVCTMLSCISDTFTLWSVIETTSDGAEYL